MIAESIDKLDWLLYYPIKEESNCDAEYFDSIDVSAVTVDKKLFNRCQRTINQYKRLPIVAAAKRIFSRVAVCFLVLLSAGFITIMSVSALRNAVWDVLVKWYEDYIEVKYTPEDEETSTSDSETLPAENEDDWLTPAVVDRIEVAYKPLVIPEGLEEEVSVDGRSFIQIDYYQGDDWCAWYKQGLLDKDNKLVDSEDILIEEIMVNGYSAQVFQSVTNDYYIVIWNDGQYYYSVTSYFGYDIMIELANSVGYWRNKA